MNLNFFKPCKISKYLIIIFIICGDFYQVELKKSFDLITYWDGFGIGTDQEQRSLLKRIHKWLKKDGMALIEVYTPWYASYIAGRVNSFGKIKRQYGYDSIVRAFGSFDPIEKGVMEWRERRLRLVALRAFQATKIEASDSETA